MQLISNSLFCLAAGILTGSMISWFIMKQRVSVYKESATRQIARFEKEAVLMKDNIEAKEKHINTLSASVSEKDADIRNLRVKIDEQKEDIERMNERWKIEFKNLANEILDEKNRRAGKDGTLKNNDDNLHLNGI